MNKGQTQPKTDKGLVNAWEDRRRGLRCFVGNVDLVINANKS